MPDEPTAEEERMYLIGRWDALRDLSKSPRMNRPQIEVIKRMAAKTRSLLEERGVEFDDNPVGGG